MITYQIQLQPRARKEFLALPVDIASKVHEAIRSLQTDPRPRQSIQLSGGQGHRLRIGRGPQAIEAASRRKVVPPDPDVARVFDNAKAVNEALRGLVHLANQFAHSRRKTA